MVQSYLKDALLKRYQISRQVISNAAYVCLFSVN